jgi:hypothetical protein
MIQLRRAILEIRFGPLASRKAIVAGGETLRVGRTERADFVIPHDAQMSAAHFAVTWDGARCQVRDLDSAKGTFLQGERISEADVTNGAWIHAGETSFMVYFEDHSPRGGGPHLDEAEVMARAALLRASGPVFAVVDAARGPRPLQLLREAIDEHRSLYDGVGGEALAHCAPYLVRLHPDSALLERLLREGWGARWGIYLGSERPFVEVRRHLRRFLLVEDDESGERFLFRFYDPRTLRLLLPSCTPRQRADFFGDLGWFAAEGEDGALVRFLSDAAVVA